MHESKDVVRDCVSVQDFNSGTALDIFWGIASIVNKLKHFGASCHLCVSREMTSIACDICHRIAAILRLTSRIVRGM